MVFGLFLAEGFSLSKHLLLLLCKPFAQFWELARVKGKEDEKNVVIE